MKFKNKLSIIGYSIFIIAICTLLYVSAKSLTLPKDSTSSLYLLSALAQSQAAIFAIVISLNLIGVQLIAITYSLRVVDILTEDFKYFWTIYGISIFYDLILMNMLPDELTNVHHYLVIVSVFLALLAYLAIISQVTSLTIFLTPSNIVSKLSGDNNKIFDFTVGSIKQNDISSYKEGLSALCKPAKEGLSALFKSKSAEEHAVLYEEFEQILAHILRIGGLTISLRNDEATLEVNRIIWEIFKTNSSEWAIFIDGIDSLATNSIRNNLEVSASMSIHILSNTANIHQNEPSNLPYSPMVVLDIERKLFGIGQLLSELNLENLTIKVVQAIDSIVKNMIKHNNIFHSSLIKNCGILGMNSAENKWERTTEKILVILGEVLINSIDQKNNSMNLAIDNIGQISVICAKNGFEDAISTTFDTYNIIQKIVEDDKREVTNNQVFRWVKLIQENSLQNGFDSFAGNFVLNYCDE